MKNYLRHLKLLIFVLPVAFLLLSYSFKDSTYLFLTVISLFLSIFIVSSNIFKNKNLSLNFKKNLFSQKKSKAINKGKLKKITNKKLLILYLSLSFVVFTLFFTLIGVYFLSITPSIHNIIFEYFVSQILALKMTWIFLAVLIIILVFIGSGFSFKNSDKNFEFQFEFEYKKSLLINRLLSALGALLISFIISFFVVYIYALVQLNISVLALQTIPNAVGVTYGKAQINNKLKAMTISPQVISADNNLSNTILAIIISGRANQKSYYQIRILKSIPHFLVFPFNVNNQSIVLVNNTLIINSIDKDIMQTISPALAHLFLSNYFKNHIWKTDPNIIILSRQDYLTFRQGEINDQIQKIADEINKVDNYIGQVQGYIATANQKIAANQSALQLAQNYKSDTYNNCINAGYYDYYSGGFYHYYSQNYCEQLASQYDQYITQDQTNINELNNILQTDEGYLSDAQSVEKEYQTAKAYVNSEKDTTPDELGKFNDPNTVRVVLDSTSPKGINEFLETLIHENLHYQSFIKDRQFQFSDSSYDGFWEEGLTEYFARKVIAYDLGVNINQGYPLIVKIVAQIAKKIPENTLQQIYFDKDNATLYSTLDGAYGNNFYKDTEPYFEYLSYLPDNLQLKYANNIMTRIGGIRLTINDLYSTDLQQQ